jgi:hypothetical protein
MAGLLDTAQQRLMGLLNVPMEAQRFATNPQAFLSLLGVNKLPQATGFAAGATGLPEQNIAPGGILNPPNLAYQQGYEQGVPVGMLASIAPFTKGMPIGASIKDVSNINKFADIVGNLNNKGLIVDAYESAKRPVITLSRIEVPKEMRSQGMGTEAINDLSQYADQAGKTIALSPSKDFGATSVDRLKEFYKRFGFVENKGKNKDFSISESMYRLPETNANKELTEIQANKIEDYRGSHTAPNAKVYGGTLDNLGAIMPEDVYSSKGIRLYGINDPQIDSEWFKAAYLSKGNPDKLVDVYRAVPKGVKDINNGDWVTTSKTYAKNHGESALNDEYEIISKKVKASTLSSEGYPYEFGYNE